MRLNIPNIVMLLALFPPFNFQFVHWGFFGMLVKWWKQRFSQTHKTWKKQTCHLCLEIILLWSIVTSYISKILCRRKFDLPNQNIKMRLKPIQVRIRKYQTWTGSQKSKSICPHRFSFVRICHLHVAEFVFALFLWLGWVVVGNGF